MEQYLIISNDGTFEIVDGVERNDWKPVGVRHLEFQLKSFNQTECAMFELFTDDGQYFDSCFTNEKFENMVLDVHTYRNCGKEFAILILKDYHGETIEIKDIVFSDDITGKLFRNLKLTQLKPCGSQMMGYILDTVNGTTVVFDGGSAKDGAQLESEILKRHGKIDYLFITHYHCDHICAVMEAIRSGKIKIGKVFFNFPEIELLADRGDKDNHLVGEFLELIRCADEIVTPKKGDEWTIDGLRVRVLNNAYFGKGDNFVNDSSVVYKVETGTVDILFLGDLGLYGDELLKDAYFKKEIATCRMVQMAHHGQNGVTKRFYEHTDVKYCLYPTPLWLWNNDHGNGKGTHIWKTIQTREWMREQKVLRNYASISGENIIIE